MSMLQAYVLGLLYLFLLCPLICSVLSSALSSKCGMQAMFTPLLSCAYLYPLAIVVNRFHQRPCILARCASTGAACGNVAAL